MSPKQFVALAFGVLCIILIASTGAFSEIIEGFSSAMGIYGFIIGVLIVLVIIAGFLGIKGGRR
jgi:hypothetical protein